MKKIESYPNKQVEQELYQYEIGNALGAEIEEEKQAHRIKYNRLQIHPDAIKEHDLFPKKHTSIYK